jgi:hypothetical protein
MTLGARDLRRGMDVFSSDGVLLGSIVHITGRPRPPLSETAPAPVETTTTGPAFSGESLGPMPTVSLGNRGPAHQQQAGDYATGSRGGGEADAEPAELWVFRTLVALNWATLRPRLRRYPVSLVLHVSHERIVLAATAADLDIS